MIWLSCKINNARWWLRRAWTKLRFLFTGDCGMACGVTTFRKLDGTPFQQFVPEAECPIHDIFPNKAVDMSDTCTCEKGMKYCFPIVSNVNVRGILVLNGVNCAQFERLRREIEEALKNKSLEDGLLILHEVPEVLYIPVGGANDQVGG